METKLERIRKELHNNSKIIVREESREETPKLEVATTVQTVNFHVAPKTPIADAKTLQEMMMKLITGVQPDGANEFNDAGYFLEFGLLFFKEEVGTQILKGELSGEFISTDEGIKIERGPHKKIIDTKIPLKREIFVRMYPTISLMEEEFPRTAVPKTELKEILKNQIKK